MHTKKSKQLLYLDESQVRSLLPPAKVLELVEASFREYAMGEAVNPIKLHLPIYPDYEGYINSMPAYLRRLKIAGAKIVSVYKDNPSVFKVPSTVGLVLLHDPKTGIPYAVMGGTYITAARTGAVMGVMAKYLANPDSKSLTIIGTGAQGLHSFIMISTALKNIEEVRLVDISQESKDRFIAQASQIFPDIRYVQYADIPSACMNADIILAAATSEEPLLADINFTKGSTVLIVEEDISNKFVNKFDQFIGDFKECLVERVNDDSRHHCEITGQTFEELSLDAVNGEIGDIITGKIPGRVNDEEIIMAASVGMGIQDIIVAQEAYEKANNGNIGTILDFLN